jgi:hypothetical protein
VTTKIKSGDFKYNKEATYSIPVLQIMKEMKNILVTFPHKKKFLLSELASITILSFYVNHYCGIFKCIESTDTPTSNFWNQNWFH